MKGALEMSLDTASKWACVMCAVLTFGFGMLQFLGIRASNASGVWFPAASLVSAVTCAILFYVGIRQRKPDYPADASPPKPERDHIYIGPGGTPLWFVNEKVKIDLKLFTCTTAQLLHIKVNLGSSPDLVPLSDAEPEQIQSGKVFSKTLERTLTDDELHYLQKEIILIEGIAKFTGNLEVPFVFQAVPWRA